jgi:hypothetical protein
MGWRPLKGASRRTLRKTGVVVASVTAILAAAFLLMPIAVRALVQTFEFLLRASLWLATSIGRGDDSWTIAAAVGRGITTALVTPGAMGVLGVLLLVGAGALFGLQRLLDSDDEPEEESPR